jgi:hypothetical protein
MRGVAVGALELRIQRHVDTLLDDVRFPGSRPARVARRGELRRKSRRRGDEALATTERGKKMVVGLAEQFESGVVGQPGSCDVAFVNHVVVDDRYDGSCAATSALDLEQ